MRRKTCHTGQVPEGDTLHQAARRLRPLLTGQRVLQLELPRRTEDTAGMVGQRVLGVEARGKNLLVHFDNGLSLHIHLRMLGRIRTSRRGAAAAAPANLVANLVTEAHCMEVTKAPVARLIRTRDLVRDFHFRNLGPDILGVEFDGREALRRLRARNGRALGENLLDQGVTAGIGNVWKSELCFNCRLDPYAPTYNYTDTELIGILELAREQMNENVRPQRSARDPFSPPNYKRRARIKPRLAEGPLSVYGRAGEACFDCGTPIARGTQGQSQRSTYHCPGCQPPRPPHTPRGLRQ